MYLAEISFDVVFEKLVEQGPLGIFVGVICWLLWRYAPRLAEGHLDYLTKTAEESAKQTSASERIAETQESLTDLNHKQAETLKKLCEEQGKRNDPTGKGFENHVFSTRDTNLALRLLAEAKRMETNNSDAAKKIEEAIVVLRKNQ